MMCVLLCIYTYARRSSLDSVLSGYKEHQEKCRKEIRKILTGRESDDFTW